MVKLVRMRTGTGEQLHDRAHIVQAQRIGHGESVFHIFSRIRMVLSRTTLLNVDSNESCLHVVSQAALPCSGG
jgi:hypothetical protein